MSENVNSIQTKISDGILNAVNSIKEDREKHYMNNPAPLQGDSKNIISSYGNKNALISGGAGIIPGPFGMAASIPEILAIMNNQIKMIYDIGKAHGKDKEMNKELIVGILLGSIGSGAIALVTVQGGKVMAKRVGARALQNIVHILGGRILQKTATSMAAKWVPFAGAAAMATWSKYSTHKIGEKAIEIFSREISFVDEDIIDIEIREVSLTTPEAILIAKIEALINLMKIDGVKHDLELKHIKAIINESDLSDLTKVNLLTNLISEELIAVNYDIFKENNEDALSLIIDLIALSRKDGVVHIAEEHYIRQIAEKIGFPSDELNRLM